MNHQGQGPDNRMTTRGLSEESTRRVPQLTRVPPACSQMRTRVVLRRAAATRPASSEPPSNHLPVLTRHTRRLRKGSTARGIDHQLLPPPRERLLGQGTTAAIRWFDRRALCFRGQRILGRDPKGRGIPFRRPSYFDSTRAARAAPWRTRVLRPSAGVGSGEGGGEGGRSSVPDTAARARAPSSGPTRHPPPG